MTHSALLAAQLRRFLDLPSSAAITPSLLAEAVQAAPPEKLAALFDAVARSYEDADVQNARLHRALEVSTGENDALAAELRRRQADAEDARDASERRFQVIMELLPDIVSLLGLDGTLVYNSPACTRIHGWTVEDLAGRQTFELIHPDDRERVSATMAELLASAGTVSTVQYRYLNKDGTYVWMEATAANHSDNRAISGVVAVSRDISERRKVEERVRISETRYRNLADLLPMPVFEADLLGRLQFANKALVTIFGADRTGLEAAVSGLFTREGAETLARHLARYPGDGPLTDEITGLRADGSPFPVELNSAPVIRDGVVVGIRGAMLDLTDRHRVQTEMVRAQKLESIGLLAGGIAHDFNNILTGIQGNVSLAAAQPCASDAIRALLAETERATVRAAELTRQLLTFARGGAPALKPVPVGPLCREVASFVLRGSRVRAEVDVAPDLPDLLADEGQIGQALGNLVINAREAMPHGGTVSITARLAREGGKPRIRITVSDEGQGIPAHILPKIFDPYVSTKGGGHGLGLASAYSIVRRHGGTLTVDSPPGCGATFEILLPATHERRTPDRPNARAGQRTPIAGRVLVMDDEAMILRLIRATLRGTGLEVDTCSDGTEAIAAVDAAVDAGRPYDAVIMDLTIPGGVGGLEAAKVILGRHPDARLIVSSGYCDDPVMADHHAHGFMAAVPKPFNASTLIETVRGVIGGGD
ncbi:MAG: PAS domain S-box protein [Deltaproteobacteria bacterium]|nr:MAG: PAS domain S-box protein [Deltaproteobacteria bacterium]